METKKIIRRLLEKVKHGMKLYNKASKANAVEIMEAELSEMENIFGLLVLGSFVGFPSPPMQITLDLLPDMEKHFILMLNKVDTAEEPISDLLSTFDIM